jgi:hypothetical protein
MSLFANCYLFVVQYLACTYSHELSRFVHRSATWIRHCSTGSFNLFRVHQSWTVIPHTHHHAASRDGYAVHFESSNVCWRTDSLSMRMVRATVDITWAVPFGACRNPQQTLPHITFLKLQCDEVMHDAVMCHCQSHP